MASQRDMDAALSAAATKGDLDEVRSLLYRHANAHAVGLHLASANGHHQCVELLLDRQADVNGVDEYNATPLHAASGRGRHKCVALLLDRQADINAVDNHNSTPLHTASINCHRQCVELLIDRGADKSIKDVRDYARDDLLHLLLI